MTALIGEVPPSARPRRLPGLAAPRRRLMAIAAAGVTGAVLITGAVTGASAAPAPAAARVVTLTSSSTTSAGHLTLRLRYQFERAGKIKLLSISFAGGTGIKLRRPVLIVSLRPLLPFPARQIRAKRAAVRVSLIVQLRNSRHFSGTLPLRVFARISSTTATRRFPVPVGGRLLEATVASASRRKNQLALSTPAGLQVGILLGPATP